MAAKAGFTVCILNTAISCITDDSAAIQMVVAAVNVAEDVAGGLVQVCAEITGVSGMLECAVSNTPALSSTDAKAGT